MKIACPQCGQHYEVEAGMLDRYFRCNECQMLFRGLNAKPVKVRKFRRKHKNTDVADAGAEATQNDVNSADPAATTVAVAVEGMADEAAEAEASFWKKCLEEDADAEKAAGYRRYTINWIACAAGVSLLVLIAAFVLTLLANSKVNELRDGHKTFDDMGVVYKERMTKLEQDIEKLQLSVQSINATMEKLERGFNHLNGKVNDQTLVRKVGELNREVEKFARSAEEIRKVSVLVNECKDELQQLSKSENAAGKQRKNRR